MSEADLVERLAAHTKIGAVPREELEWLVAHGSFRHLDEGDVLTATGVPVEAAEPEDREPSPTAGPRA